MKNCTARLQSQYLKYQPGKINDNDNSSKL